MFLGAKVVLLLAGGLWLMAAETPTATAYRASIEAWRRDREAKLKAEEGWLTLAGLFWLKDGINTVGSDPGSDIGLPKDSAPARVGVIEFHGGHALLKAAPGVALTINKVAAQEAQLKSDDGGQADVVRLGGRIAFMVIKRGQRYAVRVKDNDSPVRRRFHGLESFPINESFRFTARWVPYNPLRTVDVPNILGEMEPHPSPGYAVFTLNGKEHRLVPYLEEPGDKELFFVFKDATSGKGTYPAGRFLYAAMPENGQIILDFNKAYTPPCAFTPYATCPLPMKENILPVRVQAGEKFQGH